MTVKLEVGMTAGWIGEKYCVRGDDLLNIANPVDIWWGIKDGIITKGERPLFRVISRAADAKPDEEERDVIDTVYEDKRLGRCKLIVTFVNRSNVGTVTREKL